MTTEPIIKEIKSDQFSDRYDKSKLFRGIPLHTPLILTFTIIFTLLGIYGTWHFLTGRQATAILVYQPDETKVLPGGIPLNTPTMITQLELITVPSNMQAVKTMLGLDIPPKILAFQYEVPFPRVDSNLIKIIAKGPDPVDKVNALAKAAVKSSQDYYKDQIKMALLNYKDQLEFALQAQTKQLTEIEEFKKSNQYYDLDEKNSIVLNRLLDLRKKQQDANLSYNMLLVEYENLKKQSQDKLGDNKLTSDSLYYLQERLTQVETALSDAKIRYAPQNPRLLALQKEYQRIQEQLQEANDKDSNTLVVSPQSKEKISLDLLNLQSKVRSSQKNKQQLAEELERVEKDMENYPKLQIEFQKLLQQKKSVDEQVAFLNNSIDKAQLLLNSPKGALGIYQLADSEDPLKDSWWVKFLPFIAGLFGCFLGVLVALGLEMADNHFRTLKQLGLRYTVPPTLQVPDLKRLTETNSYENLLFFLRDLNDRIESILYRLGKPNKNFSLAFLSSQKNEGKTLLSYSLARYYASQNKRVVYLEFDPEISSLLGKAETHKPNLIQVLRDEVNWKEAIYKTDVDILTVGTGDIYLKELLKSGTLDKLFEDLKKHYEILIFDTPGILDSDIGPTIAKIDTLNLYVVGSNQTEISVVDAALTELQAKGIKPNGVVLNGVPTIYIEDERVLSELKRMNERIRGRFSLWS